MKLGKEQEEAVELIKHFISSDKLAFSLEGFAGTGKSFTSKNIIEYLNKKHIPFILCAPTHKAKVVLERFSECEAMTLHKLLALAPNIELLELDFNSLKFYMNEKAIMFPKNGIIICDEASMINDDLFDMLLSKAEKYKTKLLFLSDRGQLRPVNSFNHSKVYSLPDRFTLTKIYRQVEDSGISSVLPTLRNNVIYEFDECIGKNGSLYCYNDIKSLFVDAVPYFKKAIKNADILEAKLLAYTNLRVNAMNSKMREILFDTGNEYNKFEFLTGCENIEFNGMKFWNSMDYIVIDKPEETDVYIPSFMSLPGYILNLYDSGSKSSSEVLILSKEISQDYFNSLAYRIENIRLEAIELKNKRHKFASKKWGEYYSMIGSFTSPIDIYYENRLIRKKSFDYGYASTTHKAQGSSINNVFIDMKDVLKCRDKEELRQLQYVAVSRAKSNVFIFQ